MSTLDYLSSISRTAGHIHKADLPGQVEHWKTSPFKFVFFTRAELAYATEWERIRLSDIDVQVSSLVDSNEKRFSEEDVTGLTTEIVKWNDLVPLMNMRVLSSQGSTILWKLWALDSELDEIRDAIKKRRVSQSHKPDIQLVMNIRKRLKDFFRL